MRKLEIQISNSPLGHYRKVEFEGIRSMSMRQGFAQIIWIVTQYDENWQKIDTPDINQERTVISPISNANNVDPNTGMTLPAGEEGVPEFDFWWDMLNIQFLPQVIGAVIVMIDNDERYNRN